jgi:hypothetical protein
MERAEALVDDAGAASADDLARMLADHGGGRGDDHTLCRHGPYHSTTCSVVIFPRRREMRVLVGSPCQESYSDLSL